MTQKAKKLLLIDLSARLPYNVVIECRIKRGTSSMDIILNSSHIDELINDSLIIKPYLRSMSSMTEKECKELGELSATIENVSEILPNVPYYIEVARPEQIDWLNAHHFDYRNLINQKLAIKVTEENNPYYESKNKKDR